MIKIQVRRDIQKIIRRCRRIPQYILKSSTGSFHGCNISGKWSSLGTLVLCLTTFGHEISFLAGWFEIFMEEEGLLLEAHKSHI
jgi:hypothetical protein